MIEVGFELLILQLSPPKCCFSLHFLVLLAASSDQAAKFQLLKCKLDGICVCVLLGMEPRIFGMLSMHGDAEGLTGLHPPYRDSWCTVAWLQLQLRP